MSRERTEEQLKYHREWSQKWRDENPDKVAKQRRDRQLRRQNDPEYKAHMNAVAARSRYKKRYGMTYDDRDKMLSEQNYKCAICEKPNPTATDHCHVTGNVRSILCIGCNNFVGMIENSKDRHRKALEYIDNHNKRNGVLVSK